LDESASDLAPVDLEELSSRLGSKRTESEDPIPFCSRHFCAVPVPLV
jgi:hypothetical protein